LSGGAQAFARFAKAQSIGLDKTGTVTEGRLVIGRVYSEDGGEDNEDLDKCLCIGAALASAGSTHPVSQAIAAKHVPGKYQLIPETLVEIPGESVSGVVVDNQVRWEVMISRPTCISMGHGSPSLSKISIKSGNFQYACIVELEDKIRPGITEAIKKSQIPVYMLTGDNRASVLRVASAIGLDPSRVFADLKPDEKAKIILQLPTAMMVGDGINDTPALASAPAGGVSLATSTDSHSIQTASVAVADAVILTTTNPVSAVNYLISASQRTETIIQQNIGIGMAGMIGTVGAVLIGGCPLWLAVLLHEGSTVVVVLNSLR
jgi:cation transport ATPase